MSLPSLGTQREGLEFLSVPTGPVPTESQSLLGEPCRGVTVALLLRRKSMSERQRKVLGACATWLNHVSSSGIPCISNHEYQERRVEFVYSVGNPAPLICAPGLADTGFNVNMHKNPCRIARQSLALPTHYQTTPDPPPVLSDRRVTAPPTHCATAVAFTICFATQPINAAPFTAQHPALRPFAQ